MKITEAPVSRITDLTRISIAFEVRTRLEISPVSEQPGNFRIQEKPLAEPYWKDYDAIPGNAPADWSRQFDLRNWGLLFAVDNEANLGGALLAFDTPGVDMLEGRTDLAVLWDLRVDPVYRGKGIGSALFQAAEHWAVLHGCSELKIETQNNNVGAVRFYQKQGCELRQVIDQAYPDFPEEVMLLFYKPLFRL
jgi:GNAT superfamily N-acetyltransferase